MTHRNSDLPSDVFDSVLLFSSTKEPDLIMEDPMRVTEKMMSKDTSRHSMLIIMS